MAETICFDRTAFYTVIVIGLFIMGFILFRVHNDNKYSELKASIEDLLSQASETQSNTAETTHNIPTHVVTQYNEDRRRMHDPFVPPVTRGPFSYSGAIQTLPVNIPTRGEFGPFQQMGYLYNENNNDLAMPIMGRRIHSQQYEYYTFHHNNPNIKIPIHTKAGREIYDGDKINIEGYNEKFTYKKYSLDHPRYVPY